MSTLKDLIKKQNKKTGTVLKAGLVLLIESQEQFNKLAFLFEEIQEDSIIIDGVYVAYMDFQDTLTIHSIFDFCDDLENFIESCRHKNLKPLEFNKWYKNINAKIKY